MSKKTDSRKKAQFRMRAHPKSKQQVNKSAWKHLKSTIRLTNTTIIVFLMIQGKQNFVILICEVTFLMIKGKQLVAIYFWKLTF